VFRATSAVFWEWCGGSRLFFWRWPIESRLWAWDGHPVYFDEPFPANRKHQPAEPDPEIRAKVAGKLAKFVDRCYIVPSHVESLISYFSVPKGDSDVGLVFDGTKSGLNATICAPSFHLPTIDSLTHMLAPGSWQGDIDVGGQFYNFMLDPRIQPFCSLDVTPYLGNGSLLPWMVWERYVMGLRSSPHGCVKMQSLAEEIVRGDMALPANCFSFDQVHLNLPGDPAYNPCIAKVCKFNSISGLSAGDMATYVDDIQTMGASLHLARRLP
jgi:hypothetical protein